MQDFFKRLGERFYGEPGEGGMDMFKEIETDKCLENYTVRIPEVLKHHLDSLPNGLKGRMNHEIRILMARYVHESQFDPSVYLKTE